MAVVSCSDVAWFWCCPECNEPLVMATIDDRGNALILEADEEVLVRKLCSSNHANPHGEVRLRPFMRSFKRKPR